ncbi:MAG: FMN-binding protein [Ruminococcus sp.]|nr:FMN-binding protein [Ruminococcus sp.]
MKEKLMPPLVLTVICAVISALLALAYNATYVDLTGVMTDEMKQGCKNIFGDGKYYIITEEKDGKKTPVTFGNEKVNSVIVDPDLKACIIEITEDGYAKDGLHLLVGIDENESVKGIEFLSIGETPGLGTKVQNDSFLKQFIGLTSEDDTSALDNVTAATFSSKGMKDAVSECLELYTENKEAILGE